MIKIVKLNKSFDRSVLKNISLEFPKKGLVGICGPSGCGKSTLLNCLSGLIEFTGIIEIDRENISNFNSEKMDDYRLRNIGLVFQDFRLYENLSSFDNLSLPLNMVNSGSSLDKKRRIRDVLEIVGLKHKKKDSVRNYSGGEKQRLGIARAIIHDPKIVLADEPTGSLDEKNSKDIMSLLKKISSSALVIVVSHDKELLNEYADRIITLSDGVVIDDISLSNLIPESNYLACSVSRRKSKSHLPIGFLSKYTNSVIKHKKWRTLICNFVTSLGLVGIGLSSTINSIVSKNIKNAYSSIVDESTITIGLKDYDRGVNKLTSGNEDDLQSLVETYKDYIVDTGYYYNVDFDKFFKDDNTFKVCTENYNYEIEGFSSSHVNEYLWLDQEQITVRPHNKTNLNDNQIICGLTYQNITDICFRLHIEQTMSSLSDYLENHVVQLSLNVANEDWQFHKDAYFDMVGFTLSKYPCIYHSNHNWNQYIFEDVFNLPTKDTSSFVRYPWEIMKVPYIYAKDRDRLLKESRNSEIFDDSILEIANQSYYPTIYHDDNMKNRNRLLYFKTSLKYIPPRYCDYFKKACKNLSKPIFSNNMAYSIYPSSLMSGFSHLTFLSSELDLLETVELNNDKIKLEDNENFVLPDNVLSGHYSKNGKNNLKFSEFSTQKYRGIKPKDNFEIAISDGLSSKLFGSKDPIGQTLYFGVPKEEKTTNSGYILRTFVNTQLTITAVVDSSRTEIYHDSSWAIDFYQCVMGFSIIDLLPTLVSFETSDLSSLDEDIGVLKKAFPQYTITNPYAKVNESVQEVCSYVRIILYILSGLAIVISCLLLSISNYLHSIEHKKEFALARYIGVNKNESKKFIYFYSFFQCLYSFLTAVVEMIFVSYILSYAISSSMHSSFIFTQNPNSYLLMLISAIGICFISSYFISHRISKTPLSNILYD